MAKVDKGDCEDMIARLRNFTKAKSDGEMLRGRRNVENVKHWSERRSSGYVEWLLALLDTWRHPHMPH